MLSIIVLKIIMLYCNADYRMLSTITLSVILLRIITVSIQLLSNIVLSDIVQTECHA
jgi:hypothetical protein